MTKKIRWVIFALFAIIIGLYPAIYFFIDQKFGLLERKEDALLANPFWHTAFYIHIVLGGIALLIGWLQFNTRLRIKRLSLHRLMGKIYVITALLSALASLYIALYATGGVITSLGFACLGIIWFYTTLAAYLYVKNGALIMHEKMAIYSYAACFAAVTLRIWLPLLIMIFNDFIPAYKIVAWLCWIPNIIVAYFIIQKTNNLKQAN